MEINLLIFQSLKSLLNKYFEEEVSVSEEERRIQLGDTGIWVSVNQLELKVGYGIAYQAFLFEFEEINQGLDVLKRLLSKKKKN